MMSEDQQKPRETRNIEWTSELEDAVIAGITDRELNLRALARELKISPAAIVRRTRANAEFERAYNVAMEIRGEIDFDDMDELLTEKPPLVEGRVDTGWVQHHRTRVDGKKWMIGKRFASKYGEKIQQEHSGEISGVVQLVTTIPRPQRADGD